MSADDIKPFMRPVARRTVLAGIAALPVVALSAVPAAAEAFSPERVLLAAALDGVNEARRAFDAASAVLEATLPRLHPTLLWLGGKKGFVPYWMCAPERHHYNGEFARRATGGPLGDDNRTIVRSDLIQQQIDLRPDARPPRVLRRLLRRARRFEDGVKRAEAASGIAKRAGDLCVAQRQLGDLAQDICDRPASTMDELRDKATAITAYAASGDEGWRKAQLGGWGLRLAEELLAITGSVS